MKNVTTNNKSKNKSKPTDKSTRQPNEAAKKPKTGRPTRYTKALAARILAEIADGRSVRYISKMPDMPVASTIFRWLTIYKDFTEQYTRAREVGAESIADEIFEIADNSTNDYIEKLDKDDLPVGYIVNGEAIQRSRVWIDARKWYLSKILTKKFGDKISIAGDNDSPLKVKFSDMSDEELEDAIKNRLSDGKD